MKVLRRFLLVVHYFTIYHGVYAQLRTNFIMKRMEKCDPKADYPISFNNITISTVKNVQYISYNAIFRVAFDNTIHESNTVEMLPGGDIAVFLFKMRERKGCDAIHKYMGEFVYDLERTAGLIPGMCPIPTGRYSLHNAPLNYEKISLQTFPFGNLRMTFEASDSQKNVVNCMILELENRQ